MRSESKPDYWRSVMMGDTIILSDKPTILQRMAEGKGPTPESYRVDFTQTIKNDLAVWKMLCIQSGLFLLVKIVDSTVQLAIYKESDWEPCTRGEIMGTERDFIFSPPENFDPNVGFQGNVNELRYAAEIPHGEIVYTQKPQGEQNGEVSFNPLRSGVNNWAATIVEYKTEQSQDEPELLILEAGEPETGVIHLLLGRLLKANDVKVLKQ